MRSWSSPGVPQLPGRGTAPQLFDTVRQQLIRPNISENVATLYVCGITPYDATHLGHAFTYLAFDTMQRAWLDAGITPRFVQNITDVDDPLLERATQTHVHWRALADDQIALFREDMVALRMLAPEEYVAVTESITLIAETVSKLLEAGVGYRVPTADAEVDDVYFDVVYASNHSVWKNGSISGLSEPEMLQLCAERGGDPERVGKRNPLDPLLWRGARAGEPRWETCVGPGRPGWHIECSAIAVDRLGPDFTVQGGGADLVFPHHEYSAAHAAAQTGLPLAQLYSHAGLVSYQGEKMSKSRGNLVFVSRLLASGLDPSALRLALLKHHYRTEWQWRDEMADEATLQLTRWRERLGELPSTPELEQPHPESLALLQRLRTHLSDDLDTPSMIHVLDQALSQSVDEPALIRDAADALLGLAL